MGHISNGFNPICGLRRGSIITIIHFNIYLNDSSKDLNNSTIGYKIYSFVINHVCYSDDLVIILHLTELDLNLYYSN